MTDMDILSKAKALADLNVTTREFAFKPEHGVAVRALLNRKDVLVVLPTWYSKSLIYQMFLRTKDYQINEWLIVSMFWELLELLLEKFTEIKAFLDLAFPTVNCSLLLRSFVFAWLCSGVTVVGSICFVRSSQAASPFKSSSPLANTVFSILCSILNFVATMSADLFQ